MSTQINVKADLNTRKDAAVIETLDRPCHDILYT